MNAYETWLKNFENINLPRYHELNDIPLYLDQILEYVNDKLSILFAFEKTILTQGMINNYVKQKAMPAPIKKRYDKEQMAYIIVITILKQIMSIKHISRGAEAMVENYGVEKAYNLFIDYVQESMLFTLSEIYGEKKRYEQDEKGVMAIPLKAATLAFAGKLLADYSFRNLVLKDDL